MARVRTPSSTPSREREMIPFSYYSSRKVSNITADYEFFTYTFGGKHPDTNVPAKLIDTNMKKESAIETPNRFWLRKIEVIADVPLTEANVDRIIQTLLTNAIFTFKIGTQEKIVSIIEHFISPTQLFKETQLVKPSYIVKPRPFLLLPEVYFSMNITYGDASLLPAVARTVKLVMSGSLTKPTSM